MQIDIISLFPDMFRTPFGASMIKRAIDRDLLKIQITNPRDFTVDKHHIVDDAPFGGGEGMVLKPEPIFRAVDHITTHSTWERRRILLLCPSGTPFSQAKAKELAGYQHLVFICGHYEGFDARISENLANETISIGDYVLTGGELPAMVVIDAVARMLSGVLGSEGSAQTDSFYYGLLGHPQYTRPREFNGLTVPDILLSGDHAKIAQWRHRESLKATWLKRPDLFEKIKLSIEDEKMLREIQAELGR